MRKDSEYTKGPITGKAWQAYVNLKICFVPEKKYSPFLLEMNAVVRAIECYQEHIQGSRFILNTDHKPLEILGTLHAKSIKSLQLAMMDFDFKIRYKK